MNETIGAGHRRRLAMPPKPALAAVAVRDSRVHSGAAGPTGVLPASLVFPAWLPATVAEAARRFLTVPQSASNQAMIRRLATDPRMERVWQELNRRNLSTGGRLYPAPRWLPPEWEALREEFQNRFFATLFNAAARRYFWSPTITRAKLEEKCRPYLEAAAANRKAGREDLAVECERRARLLSEGKVVVDRAAGNLRLRGYLANLAADTEKLFGTRLYRTVATIASVVFDQPVTAKMVRSAVDTT
jgi:hypothetical protein